FDRALWRLTRLGVVALVLAEPLVVLGHALRLGISGDADVLAELLESRVGLVTGQRLGIALALWAVLAALQTGSRPSPRPGRARFAEARPRARDCDGGDRWPGRARRERSPPRRWPLHERPPRSRDGDVGGHGARPTRGVAGRRCHPVARGYRATGKSRRGHR